jgi:hypothetical protein
MEISTFEQITSALTVQMICSPLGPDIPAGANPNDLCILECPPGLDPYKHPSRVVTPDGDVEGIVWFDDYGPHDSEWETIEDVMRPLDPNELLSSSTTILDAVEIFGSQSNEYFYIIHTNKIIGVMFYRDLFKPLGRLAFLALALEIEDQALKLCQSVPINEQCWFSITDPRKRKALDLFKLRYEREPELKADKGYGISWSLNRLVAGLPQLPDVSLLIGCTTLIDKARMIWKQQLVDANTLKDVLGFFHQLNRIRDQCAHPSSIEEELLPKERLAHFVNSAKRMRNSLYESIQIHGSRNAAIT